MKYHTLQIFKYTHPTDSLRQEYHKRFNDPRTIRTNLKYFLDGYHFPLFLVPTLEIIKIQNRIYQQSINIMQMISQLSISVQKEFFWGNLRREIRTTNKIEGLHTTNQEINTAIRSALSPQKQSAHFQPFARMYIEINQRKELNIHKLSDIRDIYNGLFKGIFPKELFPSQTLFRNTPVRIGSDYSTAYRPKDNEKEFKPDLVDWITFINSRTMPPLIKACIAHFFFESIHPFNDGNGRIGRYIMCTYLASKIDEYTATSFSQEINRNEKTYYRAFRTMNNPVNHGEVTFFVLSMLHIISTSQKHLKKTLKHKIMDYDLIKKRLRIIKWDDRLTYSIMKILVQAQIFNQQDILVTVNEIKAKLMNKPSSYKIRSRIRKLANHHFVQIKKNRPLEINIPLHTLYNLTGII